MMSYLIHKGFFCLISDLFQHEDHIKYAVYAYDNHLIMKLAFVWAQYWGQQRVGYLNNNTSRFVI